MSGAAYLTGMAIVGACALTACSSGTTAAKMAQVKPGMTSATVQSILGQPARIDHSETSDQTVTGEVDHYPANNGEGRVVYINGSVFTADFVSGAKS
jgi:hypothetical protein